MIVRTNTIVVTTTIDIPNHAYIRTPIDEH